MSGPPADLPTYSVKAQAVTRPLRKGRAQALLRQNQEMTANDRGDSEQLPAAVANRGRVATTEFTDVAGSRAPRVRDLDRVLEAPIAPGAQQPIMRVLERATGSCPRLPPVRYAELLIGARGATFEFAPPMGRAQGTTETSSKCRGSPGPGVRCSTCSSTVGGCLTACCSRAGRGCRRCLRRGGRRRVSSASVASSGRGARDGLGL
jgi:hypothetical protein